MQARKMLLGQADALIEALGASWLTPGSMLTYERTGAALALHHELDQARDRLRSATWRAVGPHRAASLAARLAVVCTRARCWLVDSGTLPGVCPSCGVVTTFAGIGEQEDPDGPPIALANCGACGSTISTVEVLPITHREERHR